MRENEIIKALEYCTSDDINDSSCRDCPCFEHPEGCVTLGDALDLINSQKAEIEELIYKLECLLCHATDGKLSKHTYDLKTMEAAVTDACNEMYTDGYNEGKSEARKEFWEQIKAMYGLDENDIIVAVNIKEIDNLLAEMEGAE